MPPTVTDLSDYRHQRESKARDMRVYTKCETDPECADRNHYVIWSESSAAVQAEILGLMAEVDAFGNGYAHFDGPHRFKGLYYATGHVVVHPDQYKTGQSDV